MHNKLKVLFLAFMLVFVPLARAGPTRAQSKEADQTAKVKAEVAKRVASNKTKVKIKLRNGEEIKGRIEQAGDSSFTISEDKSGKQTQVAYSDVAGVKGRGMSTAMKIGIVIGVAVVVIAVVGVISVKNTDYFRGGIRVP